MQAKAKPSHLVSASNYSSEPLSMVSPLILLGTCPVVLPERVPKLPTMLTTQLCTPQSSEDRNKWLPNNQLANWKQRTRSCKCWLSSEDWIQPFEIVLVKNTPLFTWTFHFQRHSLRPAHFVGAFPLCIPLFTVAAKLATHGSLWVSWCAVHLNFEGSLI